MAGEDKGLSLMLQISQGGSQRWHSSSVRLDNRNESEKGRINYNNQRAREKGQWPFSPLPILVYEVYHAHPSEAMQKVQQSHSTSCTEPGILPL